MVTCQSLSVSGLGINLNQVGLAELARQVGVASNFFRPETFGVRRRHAVNVAVDVRRRCRGGSLEKEEFGGRLISVPPTKRKNTVRMETTCCWYPARSCSPGRSP